MYQKVLEAYSQVVVVNASRIALEISMDLKKQPVNVQRAAFAGDPGTGFFYMHRVPNHPDTVMECVVSRDAGDGITSLYKNHSIFESRGSLMLARNTLIKAIANKVGLSVEAVGVGDPGRGRELGLVELSTGQLIDLLAERMGKSRIVTNTHGADSLVAY